MRMIRSPRFDTLWFPDDWPNTMFSFGPNSQQLALWGFAAEPQEAAVELISLEEGMEDVSIQQPPGADSLGVYALAWDATGQSRIALWWAGQEQDARQAEMIEVRDSRSGVLLWRIEGQEFEPYLHSSYGTLPHLHLYGDTVRVLHWHGLHQVHRRGYRTFQAYEDTPNLYLTALSGEVRGVRHRREQERHSPDGRFAIEDGRLCEINQEPRHPITLPTVCVPATRLREAPSPPQSPERPTGLLDLETSPFISSALQLAAMRQQKVPYGIWLLDRRQYLQDDEGQPLLYPSRYQAKNAYLAWGRANGLRGGPAEIRVFRGESALSGQPGKLPLWMLGEPMPTPPGNVEGKNAPLDLEALREVLEQRGWPTSMEKGLCIAVERPEGTLVAEVLQRLESTLALMTGWRGVWPVRWEVPLMGSPAEAAQQLEEALQQGQEHLLETPMEHRPPQLDDTRLLHSTNDELQALLLSEDLEEAALAEVILWIRFRHLSLMLPHLQPPPEPDWNIVRMFWASEMLPRWTFRVIWTALPAWVQEEFAEELKGQLDEDQEWEAWCKKTFG